MKRVGLMLLFLSVYASSAWAVIETYEFNRPGDRERYTDFIEELRCPKCQNQNLAGSNSPIAADLRRELHRMINEGQSDTQIIDFMVARYGDFVLYRPPLDKHTVVLWTAPIFLLVIGLLLVALFVRKVKSDVAQTVADPMALTGEEQQRLTEILQQYDGSESGTENNSANSSGTRENKPS